MAPPQKHDSATFRHHADKSYPDAATEIAIVPSLFACKVRVDARSPSNIRCRFTHERGLFFFHASALWIHQLGDDGKNIFVNKEQSEKPRRGGGFSQDAIDRAFRNRQRFSTMWYTYKDARITMLSGKQTGRLSVSTAIGPFGQQLEVTTIERTLIDATVRPAYSGGIEAVLRAFKIARPCVSVATLMALLSKLDYAYPYHQAIGFYLKKADYSQSDRLLAKASGLRFNFYLSHGLREPDFDEEWKIYFPRSLKYQK